MNQDVQTLCQDLMDLLKPPNPKLQAALTDALASIKLTESQMRTLEHCATPSLMLMPFFNAEAQGNLWPQRLTHAFNDPVVKRINLLIMDMMPEEIHEQSAIDLRQALKDISYNYRLILGDKIPPLIDHILTTYETESIPALDKICKPFEDKYKPELDKGVEHIAWLPEKWPSLS